MKKITLLIFVFLVNLYSLFSQSNCLDWNEYVAFKNTNSTGSYVLIGGVEEKAAQTYNYSGLGSITSVRINGQIPSGIGWSLVTYLNVGIYNVDANNRPTTLIASRPISWYFVDTVKYVSFGSGGISVNNNFAVVIEMQSYYNGQQFHIKYTGAGEGNLEDLPSVGGTSTGGNWVSLLPTDDGDLYIVPQMNHFIDAGFSASATCNVDVNQVVNFTDTTKMTRDSMFNTIELSGYTGSNTLYLWDFGDGSPTSTLQNPSHSFSNPGVYTVSLTTTIDEWPMGGSFCSDVDSIIISVGLSVTGTPTNLNCYNDNSGTITLLPSGGDASSYSYSLNGISWQTSATFSGLAAGNYSIYVKDGINCTESGSVVITEPNAIVLTSPISVTSATCGNADGALLASAMGGTGTLNYSLDNVSYQTTGYFDTLNAGNYKVYVKDTNNCVDSSTIVINNTPSPNLTLQSFTNVSCNGGSDGTITIIGSGGTGAIQYSVDGVNFQTSGSFTNLSEGFYTPIVRDAASCIGTLTCMGSCGVTITEPTPINFSLSQLPTSCYGSSDGEINVNSAIGGTGTLTYSLDGINYQSGTNFSGLVSGIYTITVKDVAGCLATDTITVQQPPIIVVTVDSITNLTCNGSHDGALSISAVGGDGNYFFSVNGIKFYPSGEFNSLNAGTYSIFIKDGNNCIGLLPTSVVITEPAAITASITSGNSTCGNANGTILAIASGGSGAGYTYSLDGGVTTNTTGSFTGLVDSTYLIIVTDNSGCTNVFTTTVSDSDGPSIVNTTSSNITCNGGADGSITVTSVSGGTGVITYSVDGSPFGSSNVLGSLSAGSHTVVVRDANGCTGDTTIVLTEPNPFAIVLTSNNITCHGGNDGSIGISAAGGAGTLAYSLNGLNFQSTNTFNNLTAGVYTVRVRDAGGCIGSSTITITEPSRVAVSIGMLNVTCFGGSNGAINASAQGGTGPIQFSLDGISFQSVGSFPNLSAGNYTLFVRDSVGCPNVTSLRITEPAALTQTSVTSNISCMGGNNGRINITVSGGVMPYVYSWSNLAVTKDISNLVAGSYSVTVTDANGCSLNNNYTITQPSNPLIINGTVTDASSPTASDGAVNISATGGTQPYSYRWSNNATTEDISAVSPGVYIVVINDANNCSSAASFTVGFTVGLDDFLEEEELSIYPNPAREVVYIELPNNRIADKIQIIDISGKVIYEKIPNDNIMGIDVRSLSESVYFVRIEERGQVIMKKILIKK